jgi:homogentisate 1,2-dioxygenase
MLFVAQQGRHRFVTELGVIEAEPQEIVGHSARRAISPGTPDGPVRGYLCENFGANFRLPDRGPIGSNGLANARDFLTPVAAYEDVEAPHELIAKFGGHLWTARMEHSPMDVVAWHGNYAPYKYDLRRFNAIGSISFDHPDPSIFPRAAQRFGHARREQHRFRHLSAAYPGDAGYVSSALVPSQHRERVHGLGAWCLRREGRGFHSRRRQLAQQHERTWPGCGNFREASIGDISQPHVIKDTMAFMFETRNVLRPTSHALSSAQLQPEYYRCWQGLKKHFDPRQP